MGFWVRKITTSSSSEVMLDRLSRFLTNSSRKLAALFRLASLGRGMSSSLSVPSPSLPLVDGWPLSLGLRAMVSDCSEDADVSLSCRSRELLHGDDAAWLASLSALRLGVIVRCIPRPIVPNVEFDPFVSAFWADIGPGVDLLFAGTESASGGAEGC